MTVLFIVIGIVFGGMFWGFAGAITLGFIGWLVAVIVRAQSNEAQRNPTQGNEASPPQTPIATDSLATRLAALEKRYASLEARVARFEIRDLAMRPEEAEPLKPMAPAPEPEPAPAATPPSFAAPAMGAVRAHVPPPPAAPKVEPATLTAPPITKPTMIEASKAPPIPPTQPPRPESREDSQPTPPERGLLDRLLEGNIVAKLGVVILFFGVAFLLKFAYDHGFFPPGMRLFSVAAASVVMFFIGRHLMESHRTYALVLMGGAMGLLYLDVFFAMKLDFIGPAMAFTLFAVLGVATLLLAVRLDARAFASLGLLGGFLAPVLAATGSGQHIVLFSYYLVLNVVILAISWFRSWRELNFIGFLFTFAIALLWGHVNYRPELFNTVEPFLIAFFALYLAIPILFAHRQPPQLKGVVDATLIFGMPLAAAMMQTALTRGMGDHVLAWSAALASLVYGTLARLLWKREHMRLLAEAHLALAVVFGTVAPYFAFEGYPTFAFWTLEGAAIYWIGCRQGRVLARVFALALQFGAAGYFWWVTRDSISSHPLWNDRVIGCLLIAAASLATAWFIRRFESVVSELEGQLEGWIIAWAGAWLLVGARLAVWQEWSAPFDRLAAMLVFVVSVLAAMEYAGAALDWMLLRMSSIAGVPLMFVLALLWLAGVPHSHPLQAAGAWAWPLALAVHFHLVHRQLRDGLTGARSARYLAAWVLMILLASWEATWRLIERDYEWVVAIGAAGLIAAGLRFRLREFGVEGSSKRSGWVVAWALVWWFAGLVGWVDQHVLREHHLAAVLLVAAGSILLFELAGAFLSWPALRATQALLPIGMLLVVLALAERHGHPFAQLQFPAWLASFGVAYFTLRRQEREEVAMRPAAQHVFLFAAIVWLLAWEAHWQVERAGLSAAWRLAAPGMVFAAALWAAIEGLKRELWPFHDHAEAFRKAVIAPMLALVLLWTLVANFGSDGTAEPWRYVPVFNALDFAQLALFGAAIAAVRPGGPAPGSSRTWLQVFAAAGFFWLNAALLRSVHHWAGVPWELHALLRSVVAQASLSLLWTATALVMMFAAGRQGSRPLWMAGAALLAIVVAKLFLNDLGNTGTVARIVSFIGVGVFMLVIGYLSPVPPREEGKP